MPCGSWLPGGGVPPSRTPRRRWAALGRLTAPLPARRAAAARTRATDRDRRLQRVLRTALHHLDAGAVSPSAAALLAAVVRAPLPWHGVPNPPAAAAAPRYGAGPGASDGVASTPTGQVRLCSPV